MKSFIVTLCAVALMASAVLTGCSSVPRNIQDYWNSPTVQTELTRLQDEAFQFVSTWVISHLGTSKTSRAAKDAALAHLRQLHPSTPDTILRGAVDKAASEGSAEPLGAH